METKSTIQLQALLEDIMASEPNSIRAFVAKEALEYGSDDIRTFFSYLLIHGCVSGMISSLIYFSKTHAFFDTYYDEIEDLRVEYEEMTGEPLRIESDLKNTLAWFAFEETARKMSEELGIEY